MLRFLQCLSLFVRGFVRATGPDRVNVFWFLVAVMPRSILPRLLQSIFACLAFMCCAISYLISGTFAFLFASFISPQLRLFQVFSPVVSGYMI